MELDCVKIVPGGNPTVLVRTPVPSELRAAAALWIMGDLGIGGEQVGFVDLAGPLPQLAMMGGEFCGNACRALAVLLAEEGLTASGEEVLIHAAGALEPVALRAILHDGVWQAWVRLPSGVGQARHVEPGAWLVRLPGIVHLLLDAERFFFSAQTCVEDAARWRMRLGLETEAAVGCIWFSHADGVLRIHPVVWVQATGTTLLETACGSGTMALASVLPHLPWAHGVAVLQPSGAALELTATPAGWWLGGPARVTARARLFWD
ncbi:hypothetical protein TDMWS_15840 [Thermodesulfomicrobium sp. WS]|uniref:hypothetical protein n=1 Tax=Thermodesulfomicrobium sp. WS TaxID=3004129 RepID=UPI002493946C|nr:hypothetical protein [Thermodesulfomicrobium sp. WS]BDV01499.1 hypothetical protein TDMWS_15840 [Thermodesulfomicrobium sp. WS]